MFCSDYGKKDISKNNFFNLYLPSLKSSTNFLERMGTLGYSLSDSFMTLSRYFNCDSFFMVIGTSELLKTFSSSS